MKKVLTLLAVLALTAPLFAVNTVTVTASNPAGTKDILLEWSDPNGTCKGLAVTVDPDANGTFAAADAYVAGSTSTFWDIFLDYCYSTPGFTLPLPAGAKPLANPNAAGLPTLGVADAPVSVCVGHLTGAIGSNDIATLRLTVPTGVSIVTITADALRGEAADALGAMPVVIAGSPLTIGQPGPVYNGPDQTEWTNCGSPVSWTWAHQCHGDADNAQEPYGRSAMVWVGYNDVNILVAAFRKQPADAGFTYAADFDHAREAYGRSAFVRVGYNDVNRLLANFRKLTVLGDCNTANPVLP